MASQPVPGRCFSSGRFLIFEAFNMPGLRDKAGRYPGIYLLS